MINYYIIFFKVCINNLKYIYLKYQLVDHHSPFLLPSWFSMSLLYRDPLRHAVLQGRSDLMKNASMGSQCQSHIETKCRLIAGEWRPPPPSLSLSH